MFNIASFSQVLSANLQLFSLSLGSNSSHRFNLRKVFKAIKATEEHKGGFMPKTMPIHYSNLSLIDPATG